ncbi:RmlC-like jelly roll fold [Plasmopara halstedii]|uniref:RmlC-like jelly roll fold n=1 Tax=Plasmopara halstedii TaxID=4781 RepID=A0A0P1AF71_PLAHL|nr:RmlC-like jelly roll fold [Plasmopara halstedii]CEG39548.1 RmlC-like jelly roll fold [Plasmopara halstedii]|eukprot:XP_024575917.1 RmlC-like jelly roll fold [Plasmopara halstedii]
MLIISRGEVKVISPDNEGLLAILKQGSFFGEIGLLRHMTRSCTVIAGTFCELKSLVRNDAEGIFVAYPHIYDRLFAEAEKRRLETRMKARLYNVNVLDNAHAVDVSSIVDVPAGEINRTSFVDGAADDKPLATVSSDSRINSFRTDDSIAVNRELDSMDSNLHEVQRLIETLMATQGRLSRVQERRQSIHLALSPLQPINSINSALFNDSSCKGDFRSSSPNRKRDSFREVQGSVR